MIRKSIFIRTENRIDYIHTKTLKTLCVHIVDQLVHICNLCVDKATWPDAFKIAEVIPIQKSYEKHIPTNYRPISLISNIAKILKKLYTIELLALSIHAIC